MSVIPPNVEIEGCIGGYVIEIDGCGLRFVAVTFDDLVERLRATYQEYEDARKPAFVDREFAEPGEDVCNRVSEQNSGDYCDLKPGHPGLCLYPNEQRSREARDLRRDLAAPGMARCKQVGGGRRCLLKPHHSGYCLWPHVKETK